MTPQSTVLVIDDEPAHRLMVRVVLGDAGFRVLEADNGSSGLATLRARPVDVVLLDMRMPGMSGLDVLQKMHEEGMTTPVIMLTAFGNVSSAVESMKIDWTFYCYKCDGMASLRTCPHGKDDRVVLSGTKLRKALSEGAEVVDHFGRDEVLVILREYYSTLTEKVEVKMQGAASGANM